MYKESSCCPHDLYPSGQDLQIQIRYMYYYSTLLFPSRTQRRTHFPGANTTAQPVGS